MILGIIPARKNSKRLKGKNTLDLCGKPLAKWIMESSLKSKLLDKIVVSSDDDVVLSIANELNIFSIKRPRKLALDDSPPHEYIYHTIETLKLNIEQISCVVILQPTSPLTTHFDIDETIKLLLDDSKADSSVSVVKLSHYVKPSKILNLENKYVTGLFPDYSDKRDYFIRNCSVYAIRTLKNLNESNLLGEKCLGYEMPISRSVDINDINDFNYAKFLLNG